MKVRINLTIDDHILNKIKRYAANKQISVSELVETYFKNLTKPDKRKNIIELVDDLKKPAIQSGRDLKKEFYEDQAGKYGF
jgi:DNA-directed RNA polymerase beta' subunit